MLERGIIDKSTIFDIGLIQFSFHTCVHLMHVKVFSIQVFQYFSQIVPRCSFSGCFIYSFNYADGGPTGGNSTLPSAPADDPSPTATSASDGMCTDKPTYCNHKSSGFHLIMQMVAPLVVTQLSRQPLLMIPHQKQLVHQMVYQKQLVHQMVCASASDGMCTEKFTYYNHESSEFHAISEC